MTYTQQYDRKGHFTGVMTDGGTFIPQLAGNPAWREFLAWNAAQPTPLSLADVAPTARVPRTLPAIYADLVALSAAQKGNVWTDLSAGSPAKYLSDAGGEPGAIATLDWAVRFSGLGAAAITDAKLRIAAIYCRDNAAYLVHPVFDASVNVPGDMLAS